jgi:hypothetical protein
MQDERARTVLLQGRGSISCMPISHCTLTHSQLDEIKLKMHSRCTSSLHSWSYARGKLVWPRRRQTHYTARVHITTRDALCAGTASHQTYLGLEMQSSMHILRDVKDKMELARMGEKKSPHCLGHNVRFLWCK